MVVRRAKLHATASRRFRLSKDLGIDCSPGGLTLASVPLLRRTARGFAPRDALEIRWLLEGAYGSIADGDRIIKTVERISSALNQGQFGRAMIKALLLDLPELDWNRAARLAQADDALTKYDENELRDAHGRWAANGNGPNTVHSPLGLPPKLSRSPLRLINDRSESITGEVRTPADNPPDDPENKPWVTLPPGKRIDELEDLLEWVANAKPEEAPVIRGEIKRLYYDHGDVSGGNALNLALTDALEATTDVERADILERFEPYSRENPSQAAMDSLGLTLGVSLGHDLAAALAGAPPTQWLDPDRGGNLFSSYFWREMRPFDRGTLLHEARTPRLASNFPVIDDEKAGLVISTKTIDLNTPGYQNVRRLRQTLDKYTRQLAEFDGNEWAGDKIESKNIRSRRLDLIVPRFSGTGSQWEIIRRAIERAKIDGVNLRITEF